VDGVKEQPATTGEIVARLARIGLTVSATQIDNDTRDGFLPERTAKAVGSGRGRSGQWEPWMFRRAERLYRLRKIRDPDGEPALSGDVLRILLYIGDGWGWSDRLRDTALRGHEKSVGATLAPVAKYTKVYRDNNNISAALDEHELDIGPVEKHAIGMLENGEPLSGGTLRPLYDAAKHAGMLRGLSPIAASLASVIGIDPSEGESFVADFLYTLLVHRLDDGTESSSAGLASLIRSQILSTSEDDARRLLPTFRRFVRDVRGFVHRSAIVEGRPGFPTNPITMFGRRQRQLEREFRENRAPRRITPAQSLALFIAISIVADRMLDKLSAYADKNLAFFMSVLQTVLVPKKSP